MVDGKGDVMRPVSIARLPIAAKGEYAREYRLMVLWGALSAGDDVHAILRECGLTGAGSPPSVMRSIYDSRNDGDQTGYAKEPYSGPTLQELADAELVGTFMQQLRIFLPAPHGALLARHRRMVDGQPFKLKAEWALAVALYGRQPSQRRQAHALLAQHCEMGYQALRNWLERYVAKTA